MKQVSRNSWEREEENLENSTSMLILNFIRNREGIDKENVIENIYFHLLQIR